MLIQRFRKLFITSLLFNLGQVEEYCLILNWTIRLGGFVLYEENDARRN